jgi:cyclophilin family peptidyl-prolyl cis-trans isomerase
MWRKYCIYGVLTAVVLTIGCAKEIGKTQPDEKEKAVGLERNAVNSKSNIVKLQTNMGDIVVELDRQAAPGTTANFLEYAGSGFYDGTIFHRVIRGFMIQGGGLTAEMKEKQTRAPIVNEAGNGLSNKRGTIAMARKPDPDSATCQFFINHADNSPLDYVNDTRPGYAVFGKVIEGMDVVDAIASVKTTTRNGMDDVPVEPVTIESVTILPE